MAAVAVLLFWILEIIMSALREDDGGAMLFTMHHVWLVRPAIRW